MKLLSYIFAIPAAQTTLMLLLVPSLELSAMATIAMGLFLYVAFEDLEELFGAMAAQLTVAVLGVAHGIFMAVMVGPSGLLSGMFITGLVVAMATFSLSRKPYDWA